jgi:hypothetical protein
MLTSFKIFTNLRGRWSFARQIENILDPKWSGRVVGNAEFNTSSDSNELLYEEKGNFTTIDGNVLRVTKNYMFVYNPITDKIEKYFVENNIRAGLFYVFGDEVHKCAMDCYRPSHYFPQHEDFDTFNISYDATGPNKNYKIRTTYLR